MAEAGLARSSTSHGTATAPGPTRGHDFRRLTHVKEQKVGFAASFLDVLMSGTLAFASSSID
jgi:hypothetical protein